MTLQVGGHTAQGGADQGDAAQVEVAVTRNGQRSTM